MEGTGNKGGEEEPPGFEPWLYRWLDDLGLHDFTCLSLGLLVRKMGMLMAPACSEDHVS